MVWGLVDEIAPLEDLRDRGDHLGPRSSPRTLHWPWSPRAPHLRAGLADAVRTQTDHELIEQTWLRATDDFAEGVRSVNERRAGVFVGA